MTTDDLGSAGLQSEPARCIITGCLRLAAPNIGRGLCLPCYSRAKGMVTAGKTTWAELEGLGLALPKGGDAFAKAFTKAKEEGK